MNKFFKSIFILLLCTTVGYGQISITGHVINKDGETLVDANARLQKSKQTVSTNNQGVFTIYSALTTDTLIVTHVGYLPYRLVLNTSTKRSIQITLEKDQNALEEVVINTGYYQVPLERATGAFTHIDNELLNRSTGSNILERLEGVTNSLLFDRRNLTGEDVDGAPELRIRGLSTIEGDSSPLMVVDNFPYEGDINTINPNDVESVTILRDAAAASIWGARAGNGVIVINMKQGKYNQPTRISFNSTTTLGEKPDLFYSQNYLPSATVMEIQKELLSRNAYTIRNQTLIPSYVELLLKKKDNLIDDEGFMRQENIMRQNDFRQQATDYLYQVAIKQQYSLNVRGGGGNYRYAMSAAYDKDKSNVIRNENDRMNLSLQNTFKVRPNLELTGSIWYTRQYSENNGLSHRTIGFNGASIMTNIYDRLIDEDGNPEFVGSAYRLRYREDQMASGLLDWMYRPLNELRLSDNTSEAKDIRLLTNINYSFLDYFNIIGSYSFNESTNGSQQYQDPDTYFVRNLVNEFTQNNGSKLVPHSGIMTYGKTVNGTSHSGRMQINYNQMIQSKSRLSFLAGTEIRQTVSVTVPGSRLYDFDPDRGTGSASIDFVTRFPTKPTSSNNIKTGTSSPDFNQNRYLSYFGNGSYGYKDRYIVSGSIRWDGSNLLGVKTNQRGTALWSLGTSWEVNRESFYDFDFIPYLRVRTTYGSAGNIDKTQSYYPTISLGHNATTNSAQATLSHPGNPSLRWEQVNILNLALDWRVKNNRINGSIEYYNKHAKYLLGSNMMDPTTGVPPALNYKMNYANLLTKGWDFLITTQNLTGKLEWTSNILLNTSINKVTDYSGPNFTNVSQIISSAPVIVGRSVDLMYAIPWYGLNPETGQPLIYLDGEISNDYPAYYSSLKPEDLIVVGTKVPKLSGSLANTLKWKGFHLSAIMSFKLGHIFKRNSIGAGQEYIATLPTYHMDYFKRWKEPGDEEYTDVPAYAETSINQRWGVYQSSEALITKGDVIRLQDISLSYSIDKHKLNNWPINNIKLHAYARNLGILWRANKNGLDPDYPNTDYLAPRVISLGLQVGF